MAALAFESSSNLEITEIVKKFTFKSWLDFKKSVNWEDIQIIILLTFTELSFGGHLKF